VILGPFTQLAGTIGYREMREAIAKRIESRAAAFRASVRQFKREEAPLEVAFLSGELDALQWLQGWVERRVENEKKNVARIGAMNAT